MPETTTTREGEHWDQIALRAYGAEKHMSWLMENNLPLAHVYRFEQGIEINTPPLPEGSKKIPEWRL